MMRDLWDYLCDFWFPMVAGLVLWVAALIGIVVIVKLTWEAL